MGLAAHVCSASACTGVGPPVLCSASRQPHPPSLPRILPPALSTLPNTLPLASDSASHSHPDPLPLPPAGSMFASASQDGSVTVWDHRSSSLVAHFLTPLVRRAAASR